MRTISETFAAGEIKRFSVPGRYFRILSNPGGTVDVRFTSGNKASAEPAIAVGSGYYAEPEAGFDTVEITSASAQTVKFAVSMGGGGYDIPPTGAVTVTNTGGAFSQGRASLTNVNQIILLANANRRYLFIQNNSATATMRINLAGVAATVAQGFRVLPGGSFEVPNFAVTGAINAIMETADATVGNVEIAEG